MQALLRTKTSNFTTQRNGKKNVKNKMKDVWTYLHIFFQ